VISMEAWNNRVKVLHVGHTRRSRCVLKGSAVAKQTLNSDCWRTINVDEQSVATSEKLICTEMTITDVIVRVLNY